MSVNQIPSELKRKKKFLQGKSPKYHKYIPIFITFPENASMWNERRYAPSKKPKTGPNAAILYIKPDREEINTVNEYKKNTHVIENFFTDIHRGTLILNMIINICRS